MRMFLNTPQLIPLLSLGIFTFSSCAWTKPIDVRVSEARKEVSDQYLKQIEILQNNEHDSSLNITWNQGLEKMFLSNPQLIRADFTIDDAAYNQKQVWRNMIPSLSLSANDSATIRDLGELLSDTNFRITSFITLGNLLTLPATIYESKLSFMGTKLQAENNMRQEVIALYRLFQEQKLHRLEKQALDLEAQVLQGVNILDDSEVISLKLKHKEAFKAWEKKTGEWNTKVGDFFTENFKSIYLDPKNIPDILYDPEDLDFTDTSRWGLLQLNLLALERIAYDGRVLDTYLRYVPRANLSVSAPPLFSSGSTSSFDPSLTRLSPSVTWTIDTKGTISRQLERLKRDKPLDDWRADKRTYEEVKKLYDGRKELTEIRAELSVLHSAIDVFRKAVRRGLVKDPQKAIQTMRRLKEKEIGMLAKEIEICSAFWLIDEQRWRPITKRWLETREQRTAQRKHSTKDSEINLKNQYKKWFKSKKN